MLAIGTREGLVKCLIDLHVDEWQPRYVVKSVCDGTDWPVSFELGNGSPVWRCSGSNLYPHIFASFTRLFGEDCDDYETENNKHI